MKKFLKRMLARRGKILVDKHYLEALVSKANENFVVLDEILRLNKPDAVSRAQLKQDIVALILTHFKKNGFFVEFGATDGETLSNTALLEKEYGWTGILAEPGKQWSDALIKNRSCVVDTRCVWRSTGERLEFNETEIGELSTIANFSGSDFHAHRRTTTDHYTVETISLRDLLKEHDAPKDIDYLSVDTEGSEFEILKEFKFDEWNIGFITCEHNYTENRDKIHELLTSHGYRRVMTDLSKFDDWYVKM